MHEQNNSLFLFATSPFISLLCALIRVHFLQLNDSYWLLVISAYRVFRAGKTNEEKIYIRWKSGAIVCVWVGEIVLHIATIAEEEFMHFTR